MRALALIAVAATMLFGVPAAQAQQRDFDRVERARADAVRARDDAAARDRAREEARSRHRASEDAWMRNRARNDAWGHDRHDGRFQDRAVPGRSWRRGERFDPRFARNYSEIDYRRYRGLKAPPRGYRYVRSGNDAVLVAVATGIIAAVVANAVR